MPTKTIIVHLGDDAQVETRIETATALAAKHGAFFDGFLVCDAGHRHARCHYRPRD